MNILITGKHSYIGTKLKEYVSHMTEEIHEVECISVRGDDWEKLDFKKYDAIVHVAGLVHENGKNRTAKEYREINSILPYKIAKKAKRDGCRQFVFLSSISVYGMDEGVITKDTKEVPSSYYGKSKLLAEKMLHTLESDDFCLTIIRPPMVYGEGCPGNYARLMKLAGKTRIFPNIYNQRSMVDIDRLSWFLLNRMKKGESGVFLPQDTKYHCTSQIVVELGAKQGKVIYLVPGFQWIVNIFKGKNHVLGKFIRKVFGDLYIK